MYCSTVERVSNINRNRNFRYTPQINDIKPYITFKQNGFIIELTDRILFVAYRHNPSIEINKEIMSYSTWVIKFVDHKGADYNIYCNKDDGRWFLENYIIHGEMQDELTRSENKLTQRICALEDKLKVLTEIMDKNGL